MGCGCTRIAQGGESGTEVKAASPIAGTPWNHLEIRNSLVRYAETRSLCGFGWENRAAAAGSASCGAPPGVLHRQLGLVYVLAPSPSFLQHPDAVPVEVDFIPRQAVARGNRMRMVIVVPAFAPGEERHPPAIRGKIARLKAARAPRVRRRIHQPGRMQANHGAQEDAPEHEREAADREQNARRGRSSARSGIS